ncbi:MAG TPA: hypothetical protein VGK54_15390 [Chloroflexota bacterium]
MSYSAEVYAAEIVAYNAVPDIEAEFRLVNVKEREGSLDEILPGSCEIGYQRRAA